MRFCKTFLCRCTADYLVMAKKKVLLTRGIHDSAEKDLRKRYDVTVHSGKMPMPRELLISEIAHADGLVCFPYDVIDRKVIDAAKNLKAISAYSVGYDHIDVVHAKSRGIRIGHTPNVLTDATADLAIILALDLLRRVTEGDRIIRAGEWKEIYGPLDQLGSDIAGKTIGILGMGRIGTQAARRARAFGMNVIFHSRKKRSSRYGEHVSLAALLKKSDVLSIHVPYTKETHEMIDLPKIQKMKKTAFIVNTARGRVVKESDLIAALKDGLIAGAALDVFESEPISDASELAKMPNVVLAPHTGSATAETRLEMTKIAVRNLDLGMAGKNPVYAVR